MYDTHCKLSLPRPYKMSLFTKLWLKGDWMGLILHVFF